MITIDDYQLHQQMRRKFKSVDILSHLAWFFALPLAFVLEMWFLLWADKNCLHKT